MRKKMSAQNAVARRDHTPTKTRCHGSPGADSSARMGRLDFIIELPDANAPLEAMPQKIETGCIACMRTDGKLLTNGSVFVHEACMVAGCGLFLEPLESLAEIHFPSAALMVREACSALEATDMALLIDAACLEYAAFDIGAGAPIEI
jgi:hypothetical protein